MKQILGHPSWHDIEKATALIAQEILWRQITIDWIVGLTRGGLIPAVILSHMLKIPMMPANYSATSGAGDDRNHDNILPTIKFLEMTEGSVVRKPNLLIVDDIADSGVTMEEVEEHYTNKGHLVFTAALYWKETSVHTPSFHVHFIPDDAPWINFPWEC